MKKASRGILALASCIVPAVAGVLPAQVPAGQNPNGVGDGRLLDRNLQVGTGGINAPQPRIDYAARNNLITGNVTGLGYFHGRVGYSAPNEFRGGSSDDTLFRFRAQSWSPGLPSVNTGQPYAGTAVPIFRTSAATTSGQVLSGNATGLIQPFTGTYQSNIAYSRAQLAAQSAADASRLGITRQPDGTLLEVKATPFLGVRAVPLVLSNAVNPRNDANATPNHLTAPAASGDVAPPAENQIAATPAYSTSTPPVDRGAAVGTTGSSPANPDLAGRNANPSLLVGEQIENMIRPDRVPADNSLAAADKRIQEVRAAMFEPLKTPRFKAGEDPYLDLLARLRSGTRGAANPAVKPGADADALAEPTPREAVQAKADRAAAIRRAYGLPPIEAAKPTDKDKEPETPGSDRAKIDAAMAKFLGSLKTGQVIGRFSGTRDDRLSKMMRSGEAALGSGKYLDAENDFRGVLDLDPNQPLAVTGVIHAQAGAGLIRTAAFNLRRQLSRHPELVGVRYDAKLLPSRARLSWVRAQIEPMLKQPGQSDTAILLAYLGFQLDQPALVEYGLDKAQAAAPRDPLALLLRRVWLKDEPAPATRPAEKP